MDEIKKIPDSELEIMMEIWDANTSVNCDYLMEHLENKWAKTTVLNFLKRLCERGFLSCRKDGRINIYEPLVDKDAYIKAQSRSFLKKLHHNSLKSLIASLYDGKGITKEDAEALRMIIEEAK